MGKQMARIHRLSLGTSLIATRAWADVARPASTYQAAGWPAWIVVLITFILFLGLIFVISRFFRTDGPRNKGDDGGGLFGP